MRRLITMSLGVAAGVALAVAVFLRQDRIATLRTERAQVLARLAGPVEVSPVVAPADSPDFKQNSHSPSLELLKLRAEVARLGNRKRELANARIESDRLHGQLAVRGTNAPGALVLPAGYIKKSMAKFVGYNTPEDTIQSFLWAIQSHDAAGFLKALDPEEAKRIEARMQVSPSIDEFFKEADSLPGMQILGKETGEDGELSLRVAIMPGEELPQRLRFKQFGNQWKIVSRF